MSDWEILLKLRFEIMTMRDKGDMPYTSVLGKTKSASKSYIFVIVFTVPLPSRGGPPGVD